MKYLFDKKINYIFIPSGMTAISQPLDLSIKTTIRRKYDLAISVFESTKVPKVKREILLEWINYTWDNSDILKKKL